MPLCERHDAVGGFAYEENGSRRSGELSGAAFKDRPSSRDRGAFELAGRRRRARRHDSRREQREREGVGKAISKMHRGVAKCAVVNDAEHGAAPAGSYVT